MLTVIVSTQGSESPLPDFREVSSKSATFQVLTRNSIAVDCEGIKHRSDGSRKKMVWLHDLLSASQPDYYKADRWLLRSGVAVFRLTLDPSTGLVREVKVLKASEYTTLDSCGVKA